MVSNKPIAGGVHEVHLAIRTQKLDRAYQESLRATCATHEAEERRRLRLRVLLLETENEDLQEWVEQQDHTIEALRSERQGLMAEFGAVSESLDTVREELRVKTRLVDNLQSEQSGLREKSADSSKILAEKLALTRDLWLMKAEVEHLRSQLATNQGAISEKQALQRQLRAVEVELENEKRAAEKARMTTDRSNGDDKHLREIQKELEKEIDERRRIQSEADEAAKKFEQRKAVLESRLDALRAMQSKTKEQLTEAQKQLKRRDTGNTIARVDESMLEPEAKAKSKKRSFEEVELNATLGTPGDPPAPKRGKRGGSVRPGEQSAFSITPYLNRNGSVPPDTPASSPTKPCPRTSDTESTTTKTPIAGSPGKVTKSSLTRPKSVGTAVAGRRQVQAPGKRSAARSLSAPKLDQVIEEGDEIETEGAQRNADGPPQSQVPAPLKPSEQPLAKKKRIFLGKTLFDDEDDTAPIRPKSVGILSSKLSLGNLGKAPLSKSSSLGATGGSVVSLGGFSPLKKARKLTAV